eukprot:scaffold85440_cov19-Prasinocladus_malaysianus.AAC.1
MQHLTSVVSSEAIVHVHPAITSSIISMVGVAGTGLVPNAKGVLARIPQARELATQTAAVLPEPLQIPGEASQHALQN